MRSVCIIPARGGSKRIPRKNIRPFLGKPIIAYSIEAAVGSGVFNEVMVSTEDEKIAKVSREYGAKVPFYRSHEKADDHTNLVDVIAEVLEEYKSSGLVWEYFCCLLPTAPLVTAEDLQKVDKIYENSNANAMIPVVLFGYPIQRALAVDEEGLVSMVKPKYLYSRSQDLPARYHDAGQYYFGKPEVLLREMSIFPSQSRAVVLSEMKVQDIDTQQDWMLAELKYKLLHQ